MSQKHVPKLGDLVEVGVSEQPTDRSNAAVAGE
jgi:hypothetical protein